MTKPKSNMDFRMMALTFKLRDLLLPPRKAMHEAGVVPGLHVLDFGCGPGAYVATAAELVGESGKVYALDFHPLAIAVVQAAAARKKFTNVQTIRSDCLTGLPDGSVDVALLYDMLHEVGDPDAVLREIHRVLKPEGVLSFSDHHMRGEKALSMLTGGGLFSLLKMGKRASLFAKKER